MPEYQPDEDEHATAFYKRMAGIIAEHGHTVVGVGDGERSFFYSIGLWQRRLPELLLVLPLSFQNGKSAINSAAALLKQREHAFAEGQELNIDFNVPVRAHTPTDLGFVRREYTIQAGEYWGTQDYLVQQIIFPDKAGKFPNERGYAMPLQPLLK